MSNDTAPVLSPAVVAEVSKLSPEAKADASANFLRAGYPKEAVEAAFNSPPAAPAPPDPIHVAGPTDTPPLSNAEMQDAADNLRKFWTGDPAELEAALKAAGVTDKPAAEPQAPIDPEMQRAAQAWEPPASVAEYEFDFTGVDAPIEAVTTADKMLRQAFKAIEVPKVLGKPLARALVEASLNRAEGEAGVKIRANEVRATINNMTGGKWNEVQEAANRMLAKMPKEVAARLCASDAVADVQVLLMLHKIDELSAARKAGQ